MNRTLIDKRFMTTATGEQFTILHFVRNEKVVDRHRRSGIRRVDEFETQDGLPVLCSVWGVCSVLIDRQWIDLINRD